jgi:hypothetical protein
MQLLGVVDQVGQAVVQLWVVVWTGVTRHAFQVVC